MNNSDTTGGCLVLTFFCILLSFGSCYVGAEHCGKDEPSMTAYECSQACGTRGVTTVSADTCVCRQGGDR